MIKRSKYDIFTAIFCIFALIFTLIVLFIYYPSLPEAIPVHFDFQGEIDRMGSKNSIFITYLIGVILYVFLVIISKVPQIWNTGVEVTDENKEKIYRTLKDFLNTIQIFVVLVFSYLSLHTITLENLPVIFIILFFLLMIGIIIYFVYKLHKVK